MEITLYPQKIESSALSGGKSTDLVATLPIGTDGNTGKQFHYHGNHVAFANGENIPLCC